MEAREFWAVGDYAVVGELWSAPGRDVAAALDVAGLDAVDVATGTGVTAIAIAEQGARSVVGVDATPELLAEAGRRAEAKGLDVTWIEADLASVPLPDRSADVVTSTFGLIFAADPGEAIAECRRLTRPGGRVVFTSWAATGLFGQLRQTLSPYFPEAPEPWHETVAGIRAVVGPEAEIVERSFTMVVASAEEFVSQLERFSAPFVLGAEALGDRWPTARRDLLGTVTAAGSTGPDDDAYRAQVSYLVTTITET
ncbi:MAG: class I SAM-dependent methyltransferase [Actinomycetota bacterium]